jgi:hypothetical protein
MGKSYLALHPEESEIEILVFRLGLGINALHSPGSSALDEAARIIQSRHIDDFRMDRLVEMNGWRLTQTELRLAAVTFLAQLEAKSENC